MKGVKYNLKMKIPNEENERCYEYLSMNELCNEIKENFKNYYFLDDIKCNNQIIYNIMNRPKTASNIIKSKCYITKCI